MFTSGMANDMEEILRRVAAGELTPQEALPLLDAAGVGRSAEGTASTGTDDEVPAWGTSPGPQVGGPGEPEPATGPVRLIRINASYRPIQIVADPSVAEAFVSGEHTLRRDGSALVVEGTGLRFGGDDEGGGQRFSFSQLPQTLAWARQLQSERLLVRVNPALPFELDAVGSSVRISGGEAGAKMRLLAAAVKVDTLRGPLDVDASSSSFKGTIGPSGTSRIAAESSSVKVSLLAGTGVRIHVRNRMGKVVVPSGMTKGDMVEPGIRDSVVGDGSGELTVESVMSSVTIGTDGIGGSQGWASAGGAA
jgi:hypothetical protein